jgi:hypothetical protein
MKNKFQFWPVTSVLTAVLAAALLACLLTACDRRPSASTEDQQIQIATDNINKGHYDVAITDLRLVQAHRALSEKENLVLASAYAGRAGMSAADYWGFTVGYDRLFAADGSAPAGTADVDVASLINLKSLPPETSRLVLATAQAVNLDLVQVAKIKKRIELVPVVSKAKRADLLLAIETLAGAKTTGAHLYRAILTAILVKSQTDDAQAAITAWTAEKFSPCSESFTSLSGLATEVFAELGRFVGDLGMAYPSHQDDFRPYADDLMQATELFASLKDFNREQVIPACGTK